MPLSVKRSLFQTPTRVTKRRRITPRSTMSRRMPMRIPKSILPETKNFVQNNLTNTTTNICYSSIPTDMTQGDGGNEFIGKKFRVLRIRVNYDFSQLTVTEAVRFSVLINKDPSTFNLLINARDQWDTADRTILYDMILPDSPDTAAGTFDVVGPINVELNQIGNIPLRNNIIIYAHSAGNGVALAGDITYQVWYTDA